MSATASATRSCAGARRPSTISASCRPAPASATRSTSNIWRRRCGPRRTNGGKPLAYPDTLVGTDSHTTMVNGLARARLGRRRHRGGSGDARPADLHADPRSGRLPADRQAARRASPRPTSCSPSPRCCGKKGVVGKFVEFYGAGPRQPAARGPRDHRQHGAGIWRDLRLLPGRRGDARLSRRPPAATPTRVALVEAYAKAQGMCRDDGHARPGLHRHARARPRRRSCPRSPGPKRPQDRVPLTEAAPAFAEALDKEYGKAHEAGKRVPVQGHEFRSRPWRRGDRRHHLLHQHLEPVRDDRRRACVAKNAREARA